MFYVNTIFYAIFNCTLRIFSLLTNIFRKYVYNICYMQQNRFVLINLFEISTNIAFDVTYKKVETVYSIFIYVVTGVQEYMLKKTYPNSRKCKKIQSRQLVAKNTQQRSFPLVPLYILYFLYQKTLLHYRNFISRRQL